MSEESDAADRAWKKWYILRMNFCKPRIKPSTKMRMIKERDDAIVEWARIIEGRRNSG